MVQFVILFLYFMLVSLSIILIGYYVSRYFNNLNKVYMNKKFCDVENLSLNDAEKRGFEGEKEVNSHLVTLLKKGEYYLPGLLIPSNGDRFAEVDGILITRRGIYCIEIKNWKGRINGFENDEMWYKSKKKFTKQVKNPVIQNKYHCAAIERYLHFDYKVKNCVIFYSTNDLSHIVSNCVFNLNTFDDFYFSKPQNVLSKRQIDYIYELLSIYRVTRNEMKAYREEIKAKYSSVEY